MHAHGGAVKVGARRECNVLERPTGWKTITFVLSPLIWGFTLLSEQEGLMHYRQFGRTGWQVSEIAFGAWQLGGDWGAVDDDASIRTLHHAFDCGVNLVDTAYIYGNGHSAEVIGQALRR